MAGSFLILSIALNGYQMLYRKHLISQENYARQLGATYLKVTRPLISKLGVECCWLKLCLLKEALLQGYETVLFLDADSLIMPNSPDIRHSLVQEKYLYMAKGYTNRYNSGVMLIQNHPDVIEFLERIIDNRFQPIPEEDSVGWGENGHIIHFAKDQSFITTLDHRWNNTYDACCQDYIRHFNFGPMRKSLCRNLLHKMLSLTSRQLNRLTRIINGKYYQTWQQQLLLRETQWITQHYSPLLNRHDHLKPSSISDLKQNPSSLL